MLPEERDAAHLWDMVEAAQHVVEWVANITYEEFCANEMLHSAVERKMEVFGEAAGRISEGFQSAHAEIAWKDIKGIRVILAHRYGDINLIALWESATKDLPAVLTILQGFIPSIDEQ